MTRRHRGRPPERPAVRESNLNVHDQFPDASGWMVLALSVVVAAVQWWLIHDLRQLPSPIFGGDWTYQEACIRSILATGNPLASPMSGDALPGYMPLYGNLVAALVRLTHLEVERAMLLMSIVNHVASTVIVFLVISRHFGRRTGLVVTCLWQWANVGLTVRYTEFTSQVLVPLYFDALLLWLSDARTRHALYLGLVIAVLGYSHAVAFIGGIAVAALSTVACAWFTSRHDERRISMTAWLRGLAVIAACSLLALGYWFRPVFVFHGHTSPHYSEWNGGEAVQTLGQRLEFAWRLVTRCFEPTSAPSATLAGLSLAGLIVICAGGWRRNIPAAVAIAVTFAWIFHFFATVPLLHVHFVPEYVRRMMWGFASLLAVAVAIRWLVDRVPAGRAWALAGVAALALCATGVVVQARLLSQDAPMVAARAPLAPALLELQNWVLTRVPADAVVLSTNELSFAWCVLTGRKAFVSRRAQNDPFLDLDQRNRDAAKILYGADDAQRAELLKRWNITYVLWTSDWIGSEYVLSPTGEVGMKDPLLYFANPAYDEELERDSVIVLRAHAPVDPYLRGPQYPKFDLSLISWRNYRADEHPWTYAMDAHLQREWAYADSGRVVAALYRVRDDHR